MHFKVGTFNMGFLNTSGAATDAMTSGFNFEIFSI